MSKVQRVENILMGLIMMASGGVMMYYPSYGYYFVLAFLFFWLTITGIKTLVYFFTMAKYMVGGRRILYEGCILLDFGLFTGSLADVPKYYILLYLVAIHAFSGLVEILRANEAKHYGAKSWKLKFFHGAVDLFMAVACIVFMRRENTAVFIYSIGLIYSAILRIVSAFRRTTMIYIQ